MTAPETTPDPAVIGSVPPAAPADEGELRIAPAPRKPICVPDSSADRLTAILQRLQSARKRRLFAFVTGSIDFDTVDQVYAWKKELTEAGKEDALDILIDSPGGVLTSCYQIARLLSSRVDSWEALVPTMAASGATLITLGSANIIMGARAHLGPIDPQVVSKRSEKLFASERQSPLEAFEAVDYLRTFALSTVVASMRYLLESGVAPKPALESASDLAIQLVQPILSRIEPYDLGEFALDSRLSTQYCQRIAQPADLSKKTQRTAKFQALVEKYPAHEFVVDVDEARSLGFKVCEAPDEVDSIFDEIRTEIDSSEVDTYIGFVPSSEGSP